ncbi:NADH:ubiquinone oxidoreductase [Monascus purpureus]|uniref:NADH:ubiquinone oxidoreductase n=1 Tax=Monascus purpureus TaxID=5098 RepID=A0A507QYM9_MONPU|nr:NADH:ubiquinone oxidoreductase [Monascus purpureus]BDD63085.1 hypothetical protein MAP00_008028 [Monascus purpureus]
MPGLEKPAPGTASGSTRDELAYYKSQYEQLEAELADFQSSSRELEAELEKDIEASEKRERQLKEKVDNLRYEVDEWKTKYKQAKSEANTAQNSLQKEITTLRDANRTLQLKLRDIEVANDDYERQARNTTSSLEDLESKYNIAIERGVLLEEEIRDGEQERENLRIENQRLRNELSDLRIEADITQDKLRNLELNGGRHRKPISLSRSPSIPHSPEPSATLSGDSMPSPSLFHTPIKPPLLSATATPPSPPISESSASLRKSITAMPGFPLQRASGADSYMNSRSLHSSRNHRMSSSRAGSIATSNGRSVNKSHSTPNGRLTNHNRSTASPSSRGNLSKLSNSTRSSPLPKSESLNQIRGLIGKMQRLEQRVQSAKSRLPAPADSPSRVSPRSGSISSQSNVPSSITMRKKRLSGASFSSSIQEGETTPSYISRSRQSLSSSVRDGDGTPSYIPGRQSASSRTQGDSRPSSRTSYSSLSSFSQSTHTSIVPPGRSESRQSASSSRIALGHYSTNPGESRQLRSSLSNGHKSPVSGMSDIQEDGNATTVLPVRSKIDIRRPSVSVSHALKKRSASGVSAIPTPRSLKTSVGLDREDPKYKTNGLGETY